MSQKSQPAEPVKTLGRSPRSLTAPLAAFTMAILLGSYCISSIRTARREALSHAASTSSASSTSPNSTRSYREKPHLEAGHDQSSSVVMQALEMMREEEREREQRVKGVLEGREKEKERGRRGV